MRKHAKNNTFDQLHWYFTVEIKLETFAQHLHSLVNLQKQSDPHAALPFQ